MDQLLICTLKKYWTAFIKNNFFFPASLKLFHRRKVFQVTRISHFQKSHRGEIFLHLVNVMIFTIGIDNVRICTGNERKSCILNNSVFKVAFVSYYKKKFDRVFDVRML